MKLLDLIARGLAHDPGCPWNAAVGFGSVAVVPAGADEKCTCGASRYARVAEGAKRFGLITQQLEALFDYEEAAQKLRAFVEGMTEEQLERIDEGADPEGAKRWRELGLALDEAMRKARDVTACSFTPDAIRKTTETPRTIGRGSDS